MAKEVKNRISELLHKREMTQKDLALRAQITESAVSHYIKGDRVPRGVNLIKIAKALGTTSDYLLGQNDIYGKESDFAVVKTLIARNATNMTKKEKMELIDILMGED